MRTATLTALLLSVSVACAPAASDSTAGDEVSDGSADDGGPAVLPEDDQPIAVGETVVYTATGLDDNTAYRATLVADANLSCLRSARVDTRLR